MSLVYRNFTLVFHQMSSLWIFKGVIIVLLPPALRLHAEHHRGVFSGHVGDGEGEAIGDEDSVGVVDVISVHA